jgi:hypothetical protein
MAVRAAVGPVEPRSVRIPDIEPVRLTPVDIVFLSEVEVRATLVHLAGSPDPVVRDAVVAAVQRVLDRTRPALRGRPQPTPRED